MDKEEWSVELTYESISEDLYNLLVGDELEPSWILEGGGHKMQVWDPVIWEEIMPSGETRVNTTFKRVKWLCGPHDDEGNHV